MTPEPAPRSIGDEPRALGDATLSRGNAGLAPQVARVRSISRRLVRELDVLKGFAGRTATQCHAILEVARAGPLAPSDVARELQVDRSTATRALSPLIDEGELRVVRDPSNARSRPVELTAKGKRQVAELDRLADGRVAGALSLLSFEQRERVVEGLALYAEALRRARERAEIVLAPMRAKDGPPMTAVIREVMPEFGATGPGTAMEDPELDDLVSTFRRPGHAFLVARRGDEVLGGGGIAPLAGGSPEVCELQKLYLRRETRGLGLGRDLLSRCLSAAGELGYRRVYLETIEEMVQARRLYESFGFSRLDQPLGDTGHFRCGAWYLLELEDDGGD